MSQSTRNEISAAAAGITIHVIVQIKRAIPIVRRLLLLIMAKSPQAILLGSGGKAADCLRQT